VLNEVTIFTQKENKVFPLILTFKKLKISLDICIDVFKVYILMGFFKDVVYANIPITSERKNYRKRNMFQGQQTGATRTRSKHTHTNELAVLHKVCLVNYKFWSFILCSNIIHKEIIKMFEREPAIGKVLGLSICFSRFLRNFLEAL
jgi:hypothetical protein